MMWKNLKLKEICSVFTDGDWIEKKDQSSEGIRLIQTGNVKTGKFADRRDKARYISEETFKRLNCTDVKEGDILVSRLPEPVGRACIIPKLQEKAITAVDCTVIRIKDHVLPSYLNYYMQSPQYFSLVQEKVTGATRQRISRKNLGEVLVSFPPLEEQQRIIAKLDAAFAEIDENMKTLKLKLNMIKNLQTSLLSSFINVHDNTWKTTRLGDVIENGETTNPTINPDTLFSYIDISSIDRSSFRIVQAHTLLGKDAPSRARRLVRKGDVLFATTRPTLQRIAIISEDLDKEVCSTGFIVLRPKVNLICSKFIFYFMLSDKINKRMEELQTGASYPGVNDTQVKNLCISFPPLAEQERIVTKLDTAYSEFENVNKSIIKSVANYQALKSITLSQELQSGEAA